MQINSSSSTPSLSAVLLPKALPTYRFQPKWWQLGLSAIALFMGPVYLALYVI